VSLLPALPFMIPLISGALSLVSWSSLRTQRVIAIVGCAALLGVGGLLFHDVWTHGMRVLPVGGWVAPYGIVLAVDLLSALMVLLTGIVGLATAIYSVATIRPATERAGYYPLMHLLLAGVAGSFVTGDLFNLYVWFEIMLLASFALLAMGGERAQMAGALKYVVLNLVSSSLFLAGAGLLYGLAGTLNFADLAVKLHDVQEPARVTIIAMLFLVAFGIKSAAFPLFFWLPASYHTAPVAISALFAGLLTKVGIYALLRVTSTVCSCLMASDGSVPYASGFSRIYLPGRGSRISLRTTREGSNTNMSLMLLRTFCMCALTSQLRTSCSGFIMVIMERAISE